MSLQPLPDGRNVSSGRIDGSAEAGSIPAHASKERSRHVNDVKQEVSVDANAKI